MFVMMLAIEPMVKKRAPFEMNAEVGYTKLSCLLVVVLSYTFCVTIARVVIIVSSSTFSVTYPA